MRKTFFYIGAHLHIPPKLLRWNFFWNPSAVYTKWCAQTFPPILGLFAIFDRNFAKIVAPPSDKYENYVVHLKEQSPVKKSWKPRRNRPINGNELCTHRTHGVPDSERDQQTNKQTPYFRTYSRRALCDLPQTLHGDRTRRAHHKRCHPFFDLTHSFSYRVHGKNWPNLPTRGFSAITP